MVEVAKLQAAVGREGDVYRLVELLNRKISQTWDERDSKIKRTPGSQQYPQGGQVRVSSLLDIGVVLSTAGKAEAAGELFMRAMTIAEEENEFDEIRARLFSQIVVHASEAGNLSVALRAYRELLKTKRPYSYIEWLPRALSKQGRVEEARKLAEERNCCLGDIAVGLAEAGDFTGAVNVSEQPSKKGKLPRLRVGNLPSSLEWQEYLKLMGKARLRAKGKVEALQWAHDRVTPNDKVIALLGVIDAL